MCLEKIKISLRIRKVWSEFFTVRILDSQWCKVSSYGQWRFCSDYTDAHANLSLRWAHIFSHAVVHIPRGNRHVVSSCFVRTRSDTIYILFLIAAHLKSDLIQLTHYSLSLLIWDQIWYNLNTISYRCWSDIRSNTIYTLFLIAADLISDLIQFTHYSLSLLIWYQI